ncbi:MAG: PD-(D/E)XK nuclease family protein, partial [Bdellovibrionales bacterium]|nr:PD-(D/E)XK nuclease family protein [Bdellovibrionales bacterium]
SVFFLLFEQLQPLTRPLPFQKKNSETVWDNLKKQKNLPEILPSQTNTLSLHSIKQALQEEKDGLARPFALNNISHFSPSSLNEYASCAFVYAVHRLFKMKKDPLVDWELSPLDMGALSHLFLEKLLFENSSPELSETEMEQLIESLGIEEKNLMDERQKLLATKTLKSLGKMFLKKEKERREKYPHLKPLVGEKWMECFWNEKKGELDHEGAIAFKGRVDRVDFDSKNKSYIILDYKRNLNAKTGVITSWLKNADFQLSLYTQAFEKGLVENREPASVEAAVYYGLRDFNYKGYVNKNGPYEEMVSHRSGSRKKREDFEKTQADLNALIKNLLDNIKQGIFPPQPKDPKTCKNCNWRKWCRAKHLS